MLCTIDTTKKKRSAASGDDCNHIAHLGTNSGKAESIPIHSSRIEYEAGTISQQAIIEMVL